MGLALAVGIFAQLDDEEGEAHYRDCFQRLNRALAEQGLPPHDEPEDCDFWDGEMIGYSGLHDLRRIAAYLDSDGTLPFILHSDAEGFYLPQDFEEVLFASNEVAVMVGSAPRLLAELNLIASALEIPNHLTAASEELWEASDTPAGPDGQTWERYGRETYGCVVLREGCRRCIESGAALVFT